MEGSTVAQKSVGIGEVYSPSVLVLIWLLAGIMTLSFVCWRRQISIMGSSVVKLGKSLPEKGYPEIEPLSDFRWQNTPPLKLRPFQPKYNLTMAISKSSASELIEIDNKYLERVTLRKQLIADHPDICLAAKNSAKKAVTEFYTWMIGTYLPTRFPLLFRITNNATLFNVATGASIPVRPPESTLVALRILGETIEEDLNFLLPSLDGDGYSLHATVACFVNGFNMGEKIDMKLRDIHTGVPSYKEKLGTSMDRFFAKLQVGVFIKRANWSVSMSPNLFVLTGSHNYKNDDDSPQKVVSKHIHLRCERQVLHKLPKSKALLFTTRTYMTPLSEIKSEGSAEAMISAIDGLAVGNAPGIHFYKKVGVWGDSVREFLKN